MNECNNSQQQQQQQQNYYEFTTPQEILIKSLVDMKLLSRLTISNSYKRIEFFAQDVCNLSTYLERVERKRGRPNLSYDDGIQFALDIGEQIFHMEKQNASWLFLDKDKIFVINEHRFIYLGENAKEIKNKNKNNKNNKNNNKNQVITITTPFTKREIKNNSFFIAPEIASLNTLPCNINSRCIYYSLGSLLSSCLMSLQEIEGTKLYWFLMRCMKKDPLERNLIFL